MRIELSARHTEITPGFRRYAEPRLERLRRFYEKISHAHAVLSKQRGWYRVEVTLNVNGQLIRAEERANDEEVALEEAVEKAERQLVRFRSRLKERGRHVGKREAPLELMAPEDEEEEAEEETSGDQPSIDIVKTKAHPLKPMDPEEAVLQMEMLGHDFFMFTNGSTRQVNVVYKRRDGGYGLLEPELE
jgi:putative sigma-54 modulation protein